MQGTHKSLQGNQNAKATVTAIIDGTGSIGAAMGPLIFGLVIDESVSHVYVHPIVSQERGNFVQKNTIFAIFQPVTIPRLQEPCHGLLTWVIDTFGLLLHRSNVNARDLHEITPFLRSNHLMD